MQPSLPPLMIDRERTAAVPSAVSQKEVTLLDLFQVFRRRRSTILLATGLAFALAAVFCAVAPRRYKATATIEVQKQSSDGLNLGSITGANAGSVDALDADIEIQTQAAVLQSNVIANRTIQKLGVRSFPEARHSSGLLSRIFHPGAGRDAAAASARAQGAAQQAAILQSFHRELAVKPLGGTRLIDIDFLSTDPKLAAAVANELVQELVDYGFETRFKATETASQALSKELADLRVTSERLQGQVAQMQRESGIYGIGTVDAQGRPQAYSAVLDQFQRAATTLSDASQNRILKQAVSEAARTGNAEMLSSLAGNAGGSGSSGMSNSLVTIQALRSQEAALQGQHDQLATKFGTGYPKLAELQANIDSLEQAIRKETNRIAQRAGNDYAVADQTWRDAQANYNQQKIKADALNDKAIKYIIARQEADDSRSLYEDLLKRLKEAGIVQGLHSSTVTVLDRATVPDAPSSPNVLLILLGSLVVGAVVGTGAALLQDIANEKVEDPNVLGELGLPLYGMVPKLTHSTTAIEVWSHPSSRYSQAVQFLKAAVGKLGPGERPRVYFVTSALPGEGKSTFAINLAASLVQQGRRALLLETGAKVLPFSRRLAGEVGPEERIGDDLPDLLPQVHPDVPRLFLLSAGQLAPSASGSAGMEHLRTMVARFRLQFDAIVIDGPSVLETPDACVLGEVSDVTIQVVRLGATAKVAAKRASELLNLHCRTPPGVVLNAPEMNPKAYAAYSGYPGPEVHAQRRTA